MLTMPFRARIVSFQARGLSADIAAMINNIGFFLLPTLLTIVVAYNVQIRYATDVPMRRVYPLNLSLLFVSAAQAKIFWQRMQTYQTVK